MLKVDDLRFHRGGVAAEMLAISFICCRCARTNQRCIALWEFMKSAKNMTYLNK